ncbi:retrovirus-related pol polyprotein from transposon TNT 1-94 [Tanacetum coccineum]|uniref:Retrovirus-related pol polyprotein from transposon TNT 1-94 n=1 Tax=Tanacetum coccineum TaxID=301880 RepID=A0ABQ5C817_9ASTR
MNWMAAKSFQVDIMADLNIPANDAPVEQAPTVAPPTRTDDQILPLSKAFTASSTISAIYIRQFWDTMCFNSSTGLYSCQLDEQWFNLHKDIHTNALDITPANDNNPFMAPLSSDTVIEYVNTLGYPTTLRNVSAMSVNALYQPWRAILSMINMCLTGKTAGYDRPRHPVLQILWGIIHRSNIDYAERIWEEFVCWKGSREIFSIPIPDVLLTDEIKGAPYYGDYHEHVAKYQQFLDAKHGKAEEGGATKSSDATKVTKPKAAKVTKPAGNKAPKPTATQPPKPKPAPTQPSKAVLEKKRKLLVDEPSDEGVPIEDPAHTDEEADLQRALELSLKEQAERTQRPARPVVLREPDSRKYQPLPETPTKKSPVDKFIFQRHPPMPTEPTGHADSPSLDTELVLTDSETESDKEVPAGPNPGIQDEGQVGSNPGDAVESQPQPSHGVHAGPNREHMGLEATDASSQQKPEQMDEDSTRTLSSLQNLDKDLSFTDQFFMEKPYEEESGKTNVEKKVSQVVNEIVSDAVDWAMQALLRARFRDLPTIDMKEILQQRMFKDNYYKAHEVYNDLIEALQKSLELDYSNQRLADQEEACEKKRKKHATPRTPSGSPPSPPPPPPPPASASGAPGISGASGSSQLPPPPPHPSTGTSGSAQQ